MDNRTRGTYMIHSIRCTLLIVLLTNLASAQFYKTAEHFAPLTELGTGMYKGMQGGLYPGGLNIRPAAHQLTGITLANEVRPLDTLGNPDPTSGKIVLLSIGMSNTTQEFSAFKNIADTDRVKNPDLVIVDGAQGGQTASIIRNPSANFWTVIDQRLSAAKVTPLQVQVAWLKEANANPTDPFPGHANTLVENFVGIAHILHARFPNLKLLYNSSRIYAGYATTTLNPEPYAYESGFAVKWFIERQINGDTALANAGPAIRSPWLSWGPYLWADSLNPRNGDGLTWAVTDFLADGTHPSATGRLKVAHMLLDFLKSDPTARPWFVKEQASGVDDRNGFVPREIGLGQNYPNPFRDRTTIPFQVISEGIQEAIPVELTMFDVLGTPVATLTEDRFTPGSYSVRVEGRALHPGMYFYRLRIGTRTMTRTMVVMSSLSE